MSISAEPDGPAKFASGYATLVAMTFASVASAPTPIYHLYQETLGVTPAMITLIFAVYAITIIAAFLTLARLSDFVGRKPMVFAALALNALALVLFLGAGSSATLLAARAAQGLATGIAFATLGAMITDATPKLAATLNSVMVFAGMTAGSLLAGACVAYLPAPTHLVFAILLGLTLLELAVLGFVRETVSRKPGALSVLRPSVTVPAAAAGPMLRLFPLTLSTWALGGFYLSLMPSLVIAATGIRSPLMGAAVVSSLMLSGGVSVFALRGLPAQMAVQLAALLLAIGITITTLAIGFGSAAGMFLGTIVAGVGFGSAYGASLRSLLPHAASHERAGLLSAYLIESYLAFSLPAVGAGLAVARFGLVTTALVYGTALVMCAVATLVIERAVMPRAVPST
ncbi:MAG: MFS transporter [Hyphomicrobiales bacterium]|nr:MAG: MFS transporter [Hyphomicrobiales bacterium]